VTLRIAHLSDIHFGGENAAAVRAAFDLLTADPPDLTVLSGDLTVAGARSEFAAARAWIEALTAGGVRLLALPGNHDTPELNIPIRLFAPWRRWRRHLGRSDGLSLSTERWTAAGFNSARGVQIRLNWSKGAVARRQVSRAVRDLESAAPDAVRIVACHHPLVELPHGPMTGKVRGGAEAAQRLAEARADVVLTGHIHAPFMMALPFGDGQTQAIGAGTLSVRERGAPAGFNMIEIDDLEIRTTALAWTAQTLAPWMTWTAARRPAARDARPGPGA
jgi:3',5'-cyclic AMP phosphodiesterase CpdA